jgi:bidirectional [NiFe] hydrogenase diaphorase subunit
MTTFRINGNEVKGEEGWTILEVARISGIDIPTLCFHGALEPSGACRLCMVEVDDGKRRRIVASCLYPIRRGIEVDTESERVRNVRRWILQLLVDEHPGSDRLRALAQGYGIKQSRFRSDDLENTCILCGLCVRGCEELTGASAISFGSRGARKRITTPFDMPTSECVECGNCLYLCPTESMEHLFENIRAVPEARAELSKSAERRRP